MSGFSRLLIRLWGVDTNTKRTQTWRRTFRLIPASHAYTYTDTHPLRHRGNSPRLETGFVRQSSSALCGPLSHSGSSRLYQPPRQDRGNTRENEKKRKNVSFGTVSGQKKVLVAPTFLYEHLPSVSSL